MRVEFRPLSEATIFEALCTSGVPEGPARTAAACAGGNLDRARLLASDPQLAERRAAVYAIPHQLDGSGAVVVREAEQLLAAIDTAAEPLKARQARELAEFEARVTASGERGAGRKPLEERHKRELRRHRTDELRAGLGVLAGCYRDALAQGEAHHAPSLVEAVHEIHRTLEALERNPNEALLLQALLVKLPSLT